MHAGRPGRVYQGNMDKRSLPFVVLAALAATSAVACSFQVGSKTPATPAPGAAPAPTPAPATPAAPKTTVSAIGKKHIPATPGVTPTTPVDPTPTGIPVMTGTNVFGTGTLDPAGWKGSFYNINPSTTKLPTLANVQPNGVLFAKELNVPTKAMSGGFPGIDATRNNDFAIRWEAPLVVATESDYTFRIVSDDGAIVSIDGTSIVDNDGAHATTEKSGPVHLVVGTHAITVDYFQATGPVALQLFCKKAGGTEIICPTHLP